jgi:hypothetical protein
VKSVDSIGGSLLGSMGATISSAADAVWDNKAAIGTGAFALGAITGIPLVGRGAGAAAGAKLLGSGSGSLLGRLGTAGRLAGTGSAQARTGASVLKRPFDTFKGMRLAAGMRSDGTERALARGAEKVSNAGMAAGTTSALMNLGDVAHKRVRGDASDLDLVQAAAFAVPGVAAGSKYVAGLARARKVQSAAGKLEKGVGQANPVAAVPVNANAIADKGPRADTSSERQGLGLSLAHILLARTGRTV